jgi:hypothetical protein
MTGRAFDPGPPIDYAWAGDFLDRWVTARTQGAISEFVDGLAQDVEFATDPFEPPLQGTNDVRAYLLRRADAESDLDLTIERHWASGATVLAAWHASYTRTADRAHVREAGFLTAEIRTDRCVRWRMWTVAKVA